MKEYLREDGAEYIAVTVLCGSCFYRLRNGTAKTPCRPWKFLIDLPADVCIHGRRRRDFCTICPHHFAPERFLLVRNFYHIYLTVQVKVGTCHRESCSPLPGAGLGRYAFQALLLCIVSLGDGRVEFMAARSIITFKFVIDMCRGVQRFFQTVSSRQRRWTVHFIKVPDFFWNINIW